MRKDGHVTITTILLIVCWFTQVSGDSHDLESTVPHEGTGNDHGLGTILFLSTTFLIGAFTRHVITKFSFNFPYTVALLAIGLLIGILFKYYEEDLHGYIGLLHIEPHLLMYAFLPVLLFESAFLLDIHAIKKSIGQILVLSIPGYLLTSGITAVVVKYIFTYDWSWNASIMVGAILSATDPVAVVALLKSSPGGKDIHHLSIVIEGESLLNDGAAIVLFNIFQNNAMEPCPGKNYSCVIDKKETVFNASLFCSNYLECDDDNIEINELMCTHMSAKSIIIDIALKTLVGPLFGIVAGYIIVFWLGRVFNDYLTEITITVGSPYLVFYISEMFFRSSGVLSVVLFGCVVNTNKMNISPEIEAFLNKFWEQMGYLVNTIIFLVVGMIITFSAIDNIDLYDIVFLGVLYLGVTAARTLMLIFFHLVLSKIGYGSTWQSASILMWGALRGAVSLALALEVNHNVGFCQGMRSKILFYVSGIVVLTLLINSTTFNKVLSLLGFCHISKAKKVAVDSAANEIMNSMTKELENLKQDDIHTDSNWHEVKKICCIDPIYNTEKDSLQNRKEVEKLHEQVTSCNHCSTQVPIPLTKAELSEFYDESRTRVFKAFKISFWKQFDSGLLSKPALRYLDDICDQTLDIRDKFIDCRDIQHTWKIGPNLNYLKAKLESLQEGRKQEDYPIPNNIHQYKIYKLVSSTIFELLIMFFIFINVTIVIVELSISTDQCEEKTDANGNVSKKETTLSNAFGYVNYCFLALFIIEMVLKLIGQRKYYFYNKWNLIDFGIILISIADSLSDIFTSCSSANLNFNVFRIIRIVRLFRCVRLIKWVFLFLHKVIRKLIHSSVSSGYSIGCGFVAASDEVLAHIYHIVAYKECRGLFLEKLQTSRNDVIASLSIARKDFPGIAIAINTKKVIRIILNKGRATTWKLLDDGMVEDFDCALFTKQIEEKMKRLLANPIHWLPPPDPFTMFSKAPWLKNLKDYIIYNVAKYAQHHMYGKGESFLQKGEIASGVYLIVSGRAKVVHSLSDLDSTTGNVDVHKTYSHNLACHHKHNDSLGPGSIVGEQSILVNKPRGSCVVCESDMQCYFISAEDMHGLMLKYPVIEENLWRLCSMRMAQSLLSKTKKYKTKTYEELKEICERSVLATLIPETNNGLFEIDNVITDVVVIYGETGTFPSNTLIVGPKLIPTGTTKLNLITPCKMLILIKSECDVDLSPYNEVPTESAKSVIKLSKSNKSLLNPKDSDCTTETHAHDHITSEMTIKLSSMANSDPNPTTRQEYEKKRRLSHLEDVKEMSEVTANIGQPSTDGRLTPVENIEKKIS